MRRKTRKKDKRKSPYKHKVHTHVRKGKTVHEYDRGKGAQPSRPEPRIRRAEDSKKKVSPRGSTNYHVSVGYADRSTDHMNVDAPSFNSALDQGFEKRKRFKPPITVTMRRE